MFQRLLVASPRAAIADSLISGGAKSLCSKESTINGRLGWHYLVYLSRGQIAIPAGILSSQIELLFRVLQLPLSFAQSNSRQLGVKLAQHQQT
jgi:hypothetical protein